MQRAVAQLEHEKQQLEEERKHLERRAERLRRERGQLRETLSRVELERVRLRDELSALSSSQREHRTPNSSKQFSRGSQLQEEEERERLRERVRELEEQVHVLRRSLALDSQERADFIERSSRNNQWLLSLRQDLSQSLALVSREPLPSVLESETQRLDRSLREEELKLSLSQFRGSGDASKIG